jgi:hypothetical protein
VDLPSSSDSKVAGLSIEHPLPWVFVGTIAGHFSLEMLTPYKKGMMAAIEHEPQMEAFHDWEKMTGYESKCRKEMTEWTLNRRSRIKHHHVLLKSKLVAMGVATANLVLGGSMITSYTERSKFEAALRGVLGK